MPSLRMLIMPFNLAIALAATIALTYYCYVVLLFVWRVLDTGFLPNWNYVRYDEPGKYWSRLAWLSVLGLRAWRFAVILIVGRSRWRSEAGVILNWFQ